MSEMKTFSDLRLREFLASRYATQGRLKDVFILKGNELRWKTVYGKTGREL